MAFINNGYKRAKSITVQKYINSVPQTPVVYTITDAFGAFTSLTDYNYQILSETDFIIRRDSFISYVSGIEIGVIIPKEQFEIYDTTSCPITTPTTTTTTTLPPTTTTTTTHVGTTTTTTLPPTTTTTTLPPTTTTTTTLPPTTTTTTTSGMIPVGSPYYPLNRISTNRYGNDVYCQSTTNGVYATDTGFVWSTDNNNNAPTLANNRISTGPSNGYFSGTCHADSNFNYYRAYCVLGAYTYYYPEIGFRAGFGD